MSRSKSDAYNQKLNQDFQSLIDGLELDDLQKSYLKSRWLDQVLWIENRAVNMRNWYRRLRVGSIVASALVPLMLMGANFSRDEKINNWIKAATAAVSAGVTVAVAVEELNQFGDKWYRYRRSAELLKSHGWQFLERTGIYRKYESHQAAFADFTEQIETIIQRDVEVYIEDGLQALKTLDPNPLDPPLSPPN
jgi:Protein of unknown function (DUF4231)